MNAYEFYGCPAWVRPSALVVNRSDNRQAVILKIDWNRSGAPEVYFQYDCEESESRCMLIEFYGRFRPFWDGTGEQAYGSPVRSRALHLAYDFSNRSLNVFEREGWSKMTLGDFIAKYTIEDLRKVRGLGSKVLSEIVTCMNEAGLRLRKYSKEEE